MDKNFVSVIIGNDYVEIISHFQRLNENICLFNQRKCFNTSEEAPLFIQKSIEDIEIKSQLKVEKINVILDDFSFNENSFNFETKIFDKTFTIIKKKEKKMLPLNESNYWEFQNSIKEDIINDNNIKSTKKMICLTPLKFTVKELNSDSNKEEDLNYFPISKKVSEITCYFSATFIEKKTYENILKLFNLTNVKFDNIALLSQISFYKHIEKVSDSLTFSINIQNKKSLLLTSINQVVISINKLKYSFDDLVDKVAKEFNISVDDAKSLILIYGDIELGNDERELDRIIHITNDNSSHITKKELQNTIKSFLKTICIEANEIIKTKLNQNSNFNINIIGQLEKLLNVDQYCSKYFESKNVISNIVTNTEIINWKESYNVNVGLMNLIMIIYRKININNFERNKKLSSSSRKSSVFSSMKFIKKPQTVIA